MERVLLGHPDTHPGAGEVVEVGWGLFSGPEPCVTAVRVKHSSRKNGHGPHPYVMSLKKLKQSCQTSHRGRTQITTTSSSLLVLILTVSLFVGMNVNSEVGTDLDLSPWSSSLQPGDLGWVSCPMYGGDSPSLWELEEKMKPQRSVYKKPLCTRFAQHMLAAFLPFFCVW